MRLLTLFALTLTAALGCSHPTPPPQPTIAVAPQPAYRLPTLFRGPAFDRGPERTCGFRGANINPRIFTRYALRPVPGDGAPFRPRPLAVPCIRETGDRFPLVMRGQRWLRGCLARAGTEDLLVELRITGDGQVRQLRVLEAEPATPELGRCLSLMTLLEFQREGCAWSRRWRAPRAPLLIEL